MLLKEKTKKSAIFSDESLSSNKYQNYNFILKNNFSYVLTCNKKILNGSKTRIKL